MRDIALDSVVGVVGSGVMGSGIAQLAAAVGHQVVLYDTNRAALQKAQAQLEKSLSRRIEKGSLTEPEADLIRKRIVLAEGLSSFALCPLVIEAVVEDLAVKRQLIADLDQVVSDSSILATNTSSLSVTSIASGSKIPPRVIGLHFFNPAPLMPLVEVVGGLLSSDDALKSSEVLMKRWIKTTVRVKDTPGFIVNRVARPFYGEALKICEEGMADFATIDWSMREIGGFRMGPFELMDLIGIDVNYKVSLSVFESFYFDPRFKPSITQRRMVEAGFLGRKSGKGYYDYSEGADTPKPNQDKKLWREIFMRILCMLINEAADAVFQGVSSAEEIDLAMTTGVNYPKGLLRWGDEIGLEKVLKGLEKLHEEYGDDRYRPCALLRRMVKEKRKFYAG
ncbi:MAG: 3-hydroxybutyryl-CoA dehydrogenase [Proteobacteria bacterium]|nr:MAG: 3-hydroxybutyryl-CoA dehydrogenase [Pseudomonadota bacterium]